MIRRRRVACGAALAFIAWLPVAGCRQVAGIEDRAEFPRCGGLSVASTDCARCMAESCCAESEACAGATGCAAVADCLAACATGDVGCATRCRTRLASGYGTEAVSLQSCEAAGCASACQVTCGGYVYADASCGACSVAHCCDAATACMTNVECALLALCERACATEDVACLWRCELGHPDGVALSRALAACSSGACAASCIPPEWACLKNPTTTPATGLPIAVTYAFIDYERPAPVKDLTISLCDLKDADVCVPFARGTTDQTGTARVNVGSPAFEGYAEVTGAGYGPVLIYLPTLTADFVAPTIRIPTQAKLASLASAVAQQDPQRGTVFVTALDCARAPRGGVTFGIQPAGGSTPFYFAGHIPSSSATQTDDDATGGFFNASASITVSAVVVQNGLPFASRTVYVRPGTGGFTQVFMYASPP